MADVTVSKPKGIGASLKSVPKPALIGVPLLGAVGFWFYQKKKTAAAASTTPATTTPTVDNSASNASGDASGQTNYSDPSGFSNMVSGMNGDGSSALTGDGDGDEGSTQPLSTMPGTSPSNQQPGDSATKQTERGGLGMLTNGSDNFTDTVPGGSPVTTPSGGSTDGTDTVPAPGKAPVKTVTKATTAAPKPSTTKSSPTKKVAPTQPMKVAPEPKRTVVPKNVPITPKKVPTPAKPKVGATKSPVKVRYV